MVAESGLSDLVGERLPLGFGKCSLQVQVPDASTSLQSPEDLVGKKVATSFDVLAKTYFEKLDAKVNEKRRQELGVEQLSAEQTLKTQIEYVGGSVEAACALGVADGIGEFKSHAIDLYEEVEAEEATEEGMILDAWAQMDRSDTISSSREAPYQYNWSNRDIVLTPNRPWCLSLPQSTWWNRARRCEHVDCTTSLLCSLLRRSSSLP